MKLDGPDLISPANLMAVVLPPEHVLIPSPWKIFKVPKASTFASSVSSIPLDISYILGMLSLLKFFHSETSKGSSTSALLAGSLHTTVLSVLSFVYPSL
jgi:hypothetical protein